MDVQDVVEGILAAIVHGEIGQRYILGGQNLTFRALAEKAAEALRVRRLIVSVPPFLTRVSAAVWEPWARWKHTRPKITYMIHYCANRFQYFDSTKARKAFGYAPRDVNAILAGCLQEMSASAAQ